MEANINWPQRIFNSESKMWAIFKMLISENPQTSRIAHSLPGELSVKETVFR